MDDQFNLDDIDRKILSFLSENARMPFLEIAKRCGISGAAIHQRVKKLEEAGVIEGSSLNINPRALGYDFCAFVGVFLKQANNYKTVVGELDKIPEITEVHFTTGDYALFLKIYCKNNAHLMEILLYTIQNIDGVASTQTFISLDQPVKREISFMK